LNKRLSIHDVPTLTGRGERRSVPNARFWPNQAVEPSIAARQTGNPVAAATGCIRPEADIQPVAPSREDCCDLRRNNQKGSPIAPAIRKESVAKNKAMAIGGNAMASPRKTHAMLNATGPRKKQAKHDVKNWRRRQCIKSETSTDIAKYASTPSGMSFITQVFKVGFWLRK
jgi:hypothetical protein